MKIVTASQMVALEQASEGHGVSTDTLMENAGLAVARAARETLGAVAGAGVLVLAGPGNNGADGLVVARHLQRWGAEVTAYIVTRRPDPDPKMELARDYRISVVHSSQDSDLAFLDRLLAGSRMVIDAVLGTGRARPLEGQVRDIMLRVNARRSHARRPVIVALDLPTGVNCDTGDMDPAAIHADLTLALGFPKTGLLAFPAVERVGQLRVLGIGLPPGMDEEAAIDLELLTPHWVGSRLPARPLNSHKGTFGHVLVVAGSRNYVGAAYLASQAAVRAGAGLVTLAAPQSVDAIAAGKLTEVIHLPLPEDEAGRIHPDAAQLLREGLVRYDALAVGSGIGWSEGTTAFLERLLLQEPPPQVPTVIDADGLNNLSRLPNWWQRLGGPAVLTPHPGEMATLTGASTAEVQRDRVESARRWAERWQAAVALKGAYTAVAHPGGLVRISPFANPGLASGGTGDVLTGIVGGLLAQGLSPYRAACCGVYLHGAAAERVRKEQGDAGAIASDLLDHLPSTIGGLRHQGGPP
jgi:NAD(P)H-hydrate epimerase